MRQPERGDRASAERDEAARLADDVAPAGQRGIGGPLDLVAHGVTGYHFDPDRSGDLRRWSTALVEDAALRESMGAAGLERVRNRSWSALTEQLVGHYATTIDEHRTAA